MAMDPALTLESAVTKAQQDVVPGLVEPDAGQEGEKGGLSDDEVGWSDGSTMVKMMVDDHTWYLIIRVKNEG